MTTQDPPPIVKATTYRYATDHLLLVEHPAVIKNADRAMESIGGAKEVCEYALKPPKEKHGAPLYLSFRPHDPFAAKIQGRLIDANALVFTIRTPGPKRRRRRRKLPNGTYEYGPWEDAPVGQGGGCWERLMAGEEGVEVIGLRLVDGIVRFRDLVDFQYGVHDSEFIQRFESTLLTKDLPKIRSFTLSPTRGCAPGTELLPPPLFSKTHVPHHYAYRQNPAVKKAIINGRTTMLNTQAAPKTFTEMVHISSSTVPTAPPTGTPPLEKLDAASKETVERLRELFDRRPIWTRRALVNHFPLRLVPLMRFAIVYVGYCWRAGPWRDTVVRYGINPKLDIELRKYQSLFFQVEKPGIYPAPEGAEGEGEQEQIEEEPPHPHSFLPTPHPLPERPRKESHLFTGQTLNILDGRCFQLCDITDPLLRTLVDLPLSELRTECDPQDGWYKAEHMYKMKAIMRGKIRALISGKVADDSEFELVMKEEWITDAKGEVIEKRIPVKVGGRRRVIVGGRTEMIKEGEEIDDSVRVVEGEESQESEWRVDDAEGRINELMKRFGRAGGEDGEDGQWGEEGEDQDEFGLLGEEEDEF
ncbi:hypothetical protein BJ508DRAFT_411556, partial [Ascobolus immersus RN42]